MKRYLISLLYLTVGGLAGCSPLEPSCESEPTCSAAGTRCELGQVASCEPDAQGCLRETRLDCAAQGLTCVEADGAASCGGQALDSLTADVAQAICQTLYRCCDDGHRARYFASYRYSQRLKDAGFEGQVPPDAALGAEDCPALVAAMLEVEPLGPWVAAARRGEVGYDALAAASCLRTLREASCGAPAWSALTDASCFAHLPPAGGDERRRMFDRVRGPGEGCLALTDGVGGAVYGTCDPRQAWCCRPDAEDAARCTLVGESGTCQAVSAAGESCQYFGGTVQVCATGLDCSNLSSQGVGQCARLDDDVPLTPGAACYDDASYSLLGACQDSYCDLFGSAHCEAYRESGASCDEDGQCRSGGCELGSCIEAFCPGAV